MKDKHWSGRDLGMMSHRRKTNKHLQDLLTKNNLLKQNSEIADIAKTLSIATIEVLGFIFAGVIIFGVMISGLMIVLGNIYKP